MRPAVPLDPPAPVDGGFRRLALWVVLLLTAARVVSLLAARTDLYVDEAQYWTWAQDLDWGYFSKPPLIALVIAATTGLFGDAEWAVRLSSPLFHAGTALVLMRLGDRLYGGRAGGWAAILWASLPAVALSSTLASTDAPLLFFWALGLLCAERLAAGGGWGAAAGLGLSIAVGLNAKYAMGFLPAVLVLAVAADPELRPRLASPLLWGALAIGLLGLVPNLVWNVTHDFVTFRHTGTNADWGSRVLDPGSIAEFAGAQFGVFGPVPLALLILAAAGLVGSGRRRADRFLLTTSVPILLVFVGQSALARANANWAATAYPAATVLVAGLFDALPRLRAFRRATLWIAGAASAALIAGPPLAPVLTLPGIGRPFERVLGWSDYAAAVAAAAKEAGARTIVVARRSDVAGLLYHLRDDGLEVAVLRPGGSPPRDHYQLTRPFRPDLPAPGLLVAPPGFPRPPDLTATGPAAALPVTRGVAKGLAMEATPVTW